nr:maestro heat-like repeat family member 5 isoform X7 [Equus caballus]
MAASPSDGFRRLRWGSKRLSRPVQQEMDTGREITGEHPSDSPPWEEELVSKIRAMSALEKTLALEAISHCIQRHSQLVRKEVSYTSIQELLASLKLDLKQPLEKTFPFHFYGLILRECASVDLVKRHLASLLELCHQSSSQREGIALAIGITSASHMEEVWAMLEHLGRTRFLQSTFMSPESQQLDRNTHWKWVGSTSLLCLGQIAMHAREQILPWVDNIASRMVYYFSCSPYDNVLKTSFLSAAIMLMKALQREDGTQNYKFTQISELISCLLCVLQKEPNFLATLFRQKIILVIAALRTIGCAKKSRIFSVSSSNLRPSLKPTVKSKILQTCLQSLYSLPPTETLKRKLPPLEAAPDVMMLYQKSVQALDLLLQNFVSENKSMDEICFLLQHTEPWLKSDKIHERKRVVQSVFLLLKYVVDHVKLTEEAMPSMLGHQIGLLTLLWRDKDKATQSRSRQCVCLLLQLLIQQKGLGREPDGGPAHAAHPHAPARALQPQPPALRPGRTAAPPHLRGPQHQAGAGGRDPAGPVPEAAVYHLQEHPADHDEGRDHAGHPAHPGDSRGAAVPVPPFREALGTIYELLYVREYKATVRWAFAGILLGLLTQLHYLFELDAVEGLSDYQEDILEARTLSPCRTCLEALKGLFWTTNYWEVFAELKLLRGWELFEHLETYTEGVTLLARAMAHYDCEVKAVLGQAVISLKSSEERDNIVAILIITEFLNSQELTQYTSRKTMDNFLNLGLNNPNQLVRAMSLKGLSSILMHPKKVVLLQNWLVGLLDSFLKPEPRDLIGLMEILGDIVHCLGGQGVGTLSLKIAQRLLSLFEHAQGDVRAGAIFLYGSVIYSGGRKLRPALRTHAWHALVPLLLHLGDSCPQVVTKTKFTFLRCAILLKWEFRKELFGRLAWGSGLGAENDIFIYMKVTPIEGLEGGLPWLPSCRGWNCGRKEGRRQVESNFGSYHHFLMQALMHLSSPHHSMKLAAMRFIGGLLQDYFADLCVCLTKNDVQTLLTHFELLKQDRDSTSRRFYRSFLDDVIELSQYVTY